MIAFAIIGAQKSGTTSLATALAQHPAIAFCRQKEPGYFNRAGDWRADLARYHGLYPAADGLKGEASTMYTFLPEYTDTHRRLHEYNPDLKLIYIMRHPVERIVSHYAHRLLHGRVRRPPEDEVLRDPTYVNRSRYAMQLRPYLELFGRERLLLLRFEDLVGDGAAQLMRVADFLGVDPVPMTSIDLAPRNPTVGRVRMSDRVRRVDMLPLVPRPVRALLRRGFGRRLDAKPAFSDHLRRTLWHLLEADVRDMEQIAGRALGWRAP